MIIPIWAKALAILALVGALFAAAKAHDHRLYKQGYDAADTMHKAREAKIEADAKEKLSLAMSDAIGKERALRSQIDAMSNQRAKENADHETTLNTLRADARASRLRLSIAINRNSVSGSATPADPAATSGPVAEARADIMPEVAATLIGIAGDSAKDVRDFNAIIDAYNAARSTCNAVMP